MVYVSDVVQPGCRIDAALWEQFRQDIKSRRGAVRGHLRTELETALRQYLDGGDPNSLGTVDERLSRIEAAVGVASADGGTYTSDAARYTHAPDTKPEPNTATEKKVAYLAECVIDAEVPESRELESVPESRLIDVVKSEYSFKSETAQRYVERLTDHFGLVEHPTADGILVTEEKQRELLENKAEESLA